MTGRSVSFDAIGTKWNIKINSEVSGSDWQQLQSKISSRIERFDKMYSRFRKDSWVTKLSQKAGTYTLPEDALPLLDFYRELYQTTGGLVTPLIGQTLSDAGYDAEYSLQGKPLTSPPAWQDVIVYSGSEITMKQPELLDFGAGGKGYLVDILGALLEEHGITEFIIDASGDLLHRSQGAGSIEVGLENPFDTSEAVGTVRITNQSLCASSGSRRAWGKYNHMINPNTLESPHDIAATWVVAGSAMQADGLATALFFVEPQKLHGHFNFEYAILDKDMGLTYSKGLQIKPFEAGA